MELVEMFRTIVLEFPYSLFGSMVVGTICAFLGVYIVAKRVVFFGAVLTQVSVLGLAVTFLPGLPLPHTVGSLVTTILAAMLLSRLLTGKHVPKDAVLGIVFVSTIALRTLVLQLAPHVEVSEIENLLRGDILFVTPDLFYLMLGAFLLAIVVHLLFFKEFQYISFDAETARTQGFNTGIWELLFYGIAATTISFATHMVGDMFVFGFLVIPAVAAMLLARRVSQIFVVAVLIGALSPVIGLVLAFTFDLPSSPASVTVALIVLITCWVPILVRSR